MPSPIIVTRCSAALEAIEQAAENNLPCPTNEELALVLGGRANTACEALQRLESQGVITVERFTRYRIVTICETGKQTAAPTGPFMPSTGIAEHRLIAERRLALIAERDRLADQLRTHRDPCPMCGVRADYGCKHQSLAA